MNRFAKTILFFIAITSFNFIVEAQKPNVVLFYADDLGWGDLSINNKDDSYFRYTPNIDEICQEGIFLNNYATHCVCSPSRAGLLTAKHYARVAAGPRTGGELPYGEGAVTLAQDFQASGYKTGCFGKWHNSEPNLPAQNTGALVASDDDILPYNEIYEYTSDKHFGIGVNKYGFDNWAGYYGGGTDMFHRFASQQNQANWWVDSVYMGTVPGYTTDLINEAAVSFIQENKDENFFCYVPEQAVHHPIQIKKSDLIEFCSVLESERGISGQWDYVKNIKSPDTGLTIEQAGEEIKCWKGEEFDVTRIDPAKSHFNHLIFACYIYSLDKSVGRIIETLKTENLMDNTIIVFASDNGGLPEGCSLPFQGGKHSIWEGGVHVPAAIWWPGVLDANTAPYSPGNNKYEGNVGYYDLYPTLMDMTQNTFSVPDADGISFWSELQSNTKVRQGDADPFFEMWGDHGFVRTDQWKLMYSESANRKELYRYKTDIDESANLAASYPEIVSSMSTQYKNWLRDKKFAVPFVKTDTNILAIDPPAPDGEILEVKATQTANNSSGVFIRFSKGYFTNGKYGHYIEPGDRVEYDIYVAEDSENAKGIYYSTGSGWTPEFDSKSGLNQDSVLIHSQSLQKGKWIRQVVGTGTVCPGSSTVNYIVLRNGNQGYTHFYLDNIVIRKNDGGIRSVIWQSSKDFTPLIYRYKNVNHNNLGSAQSISGFPFSDIQLSALKTNGQDLEYPIRKFILSDATDSYIHAQTYDIVNYTPESVDISSISLEGADKSYFDIIKDDISSESISPMSSETFTIRYNPANSNEDHEVRIIIESSKGKDTLTFETQKSSAPLYNVVVDHCDNATDWGSNNSLSANNLDHKEWGACLEMSGGETNEYQKYFKTPVATKATKQNGYLQFWYYVSDASLFDTKNQVELGSGGKNDINEYNWNIHSKVQTGWNLMKLKFSEAGTSPSGSNPDLGAINWLRIYHWKKGEMTTRIDDIRIIDPSIPYEAPEDDHTSIENSTISQDFTLSPNPGTGQFRIELHHTTNLPQSLRIIDLSGREIYYSNSVHLTTEIDLSQEKKGLYLVQLKAIDQMYSQKLILK